MKNYYPEEIQRGNKNVPDITPSFPLTLRGMKRGYWTGLITSLLILAFAFTFVNDAQAAIGTGGATCTNQSRTTGTSLTCTVVTQNLDANNIAILWFAGDNTAAVDGNDGLLSSVIDSAGNTWTVQGCYTNGEGVAADGATTCIAWSKLTITLTSGSGTITANFASIAAKAIVVKEFTVGAGNSIQVTGTPQYQVMDAADPDTMTISGLTSSEYLFVRSTALERKSDTWSVTTGYTTSGCSATSGSGGDAGNIETCGEFRILTATGDTSNPSATNKDNASIFIAFKEVPAPGAPSKLAFSVQPSDTTAGAAITPAVQVQIQDASGNLVTTATNAVTIAIGANPGGGTLSGTLTVNAVNGVATFSDLSIDKWANGYTLTASETVTPLTGTTSNSFNIRGPSKLAFLQPPSNTQVGATISSPSGVQVEIQDSLGNRVLADNTTSVSIAIDNNPGTPSPGTLSGTTPKTASAGVATFDNLSIDQVGYGYTLKASAAITNPNVTSIGFDITPVPGTYPVTQCMSDRYGSNLNSLGDCKAQDVKITRMSLSSTTPMTSCIGGETVILDLDVVLQFGAAEREDIGVFIVNDGKNIRLTSANGGAESCRVEVLPTTAPFTNLETSYPSDTCGDGSKATVCDTPCVTQGEGTLKPLGVPVLCQASADSSGKLYVPFGTSWNTQKGTTPHCTYAIHPSIDKAKCNIPETALSTMEVVVLPKITKTDNKTTLSPGEQTTYTVVVTNNTGITLSTSAGVFKFQDDPPAALTNIVVSCSATGTTCPGGLSEGTMRAGINLNDMPNNSSLTFTITANVVATPPASFTNTATVQVGTATASASDSTSGSGSGSGGSRVKIIKWREVFQ